MESLNALDPGPFETFVNRESELRLIDDSFNALLDKKLLLRTPIIELQGVGGIGKTSLLKQVERRCRATKIQYIWVDLREASKSVSQEIIVQSKRYIHDEKENAFQSPIAATRVLLKQGPLVMLFDAVDTAYEEELSIIESLLQNLLDDERLFVILTSKKVIPFRHERAVLRNMTTLPLKPLDRKNSELYLHSVGIQVEPEIRNLIFTWTRGYPLAMYVMAQAIQQGYDPRTEQGQQEICNLLTERVINQEVLAKVRPEEQERYRSLLLLFAIPRRFNLVIMQDLIETFEAEEKRESSMGYFGLPREINETTDVLNWSMSRAGFVVDEPIRSLLTLLLKLEKPERFFSINAYLAETNLRLAERFSGADQVRYLKECLYHFASASPAAPTIEDLAQPIQLIERQPAATMHFFLDELAQDEELREVLGEHVATIQTRIEARLRDYSS